jgi:diguanylate cyclase (GGDEF)-like protein
MIDIDHFKKVNDTYGHPVGDQVLLAMSRVLQQRLRLSDVIGRYGGEEFAVVMPDTSIEQAVLVMESLREDFSHIVFNSACGDFSCTFSAGIACYPHYTTIEVLRIAADQALYRAKHLGRNRTIADFGQGLQ